MREILFRGKIVDNGEWIEGFYVKHDEKSYIYTGKRECIVLPIYVEKGIKYEVDPETVCQYTGLTDKNGRKIFEGDILRFEDCSNYPVVWDSDYCDFGSCWYSDFDHLSKYRSIKIEVVGNVFDNPELLENED